MPRARRLETGDLVRGRTARLSVSRRSAPRSCGAAARESSPLARERVAASRACATRRRRRVFASDRRAHAGSSRSRPQTRHVVARVRDVGGDCAVLVRDRSRVGDPVDHARDAVRFESTTVDRRRAVPPCRSRRAAAAGCSLGARVSFRYVFRKQALALERVARVQLVEDPLVRSRDPCLRGRRASARRRRSGPRGSASAPVMREISLVSTASLLARVADLPLEVLDLLWMLAACRSSFRPPARRRRGRAAAGVRGGGCGTFKRRFVGKGAVPCRGVVSV